MTTSQVTVKTLAVLALVAGFASAARGQPVAMKPEGITADWAFQQKPKQAGVNVSTPTPDQAPRCKVSPIANPKAPAQVMGYLVSDPDGKPVRQFVSYDGKNFNIVSFYLDGVEAYREVYPPQAPGKREPFQYRWLGPNGSKWGLDHDHDFAIDDWAVISPEEVSQELLRAIAANDPKRLTPLLVTREHLAPIGLPAADAERVLARAAGAAKRLTDTAAQLKLTDKARWVHVEYGAPNTRPADSFGGGQTDYTYYRSGTVLVEDAGKNPLFQTGELVQVGRAWKLVDGPAAGGGGTEPAAGPVIEAGIQAFVDKLNELDRKQPNPPTVAGLAAHNAERAKILENIVAAANAKETWIKMLIDSHAQAAEGMKPANNPHLIRIKQWHDAMTKPNGNAAIAAYAGYRYLVAENSVGLANITKDEDLPAIQERWRSGLEQFVKAFPSADDAPEAALRLAMAWELSGGKDATEIKANEAKARQWYEHTAKTFSTHTQGAKATGALKRLDCEGKPLELTGPLLAKPTEQFNAAQKDKVVVVYYWAGWDAPALAAEAKKLQALEKEYGPKGLVIVTVSLDHDAKRAADAVAASGLPGTHLYAPGGVDGSPLAAAYGILAPPHIIVVGKDGKITNRNSHTAMLDEEVKKLVAEK